MNDIAVRRNKMTVDFEFHIGQHVKIRDSGMDAEVQGLMKSADGLTYCIVWWYAGMRNSLWVFPSEIKSIEEQP